MKNHFKLIVNIIFSSIGLSIILGSFLSTIGPINEKNTRNNLTGKSRRYVAKRNTKIDSTLLQSFSNNKNNKGFVKIEELIKKWNGIISKYPDIDVSTFYLSLDNKVYAGINPDIKMSAASSIKVPILIVLLRKLDQKEISWNEKLFLTKDTIGSGSGWISYQDIGDEFPIFELATEMIRVSDNTATNLLIKRLGGQDKINEDFEKLGLKNTQINNYLPDLEGTNLTSSKDLTLAMALVDTGYFLSNRSRDIFREIMSKSKTNTLIPKGILRGLGKEANDIDYHLSINGYVVYNKTGDIGMSYADTGSIQTPFNTRGFVSFIVKGPFNDPRSPELIRKLSAELIPFLEKNQPQRIAN